MLAPAVLLAVAASAANVTVSPAPDHVALTVYRAPWRGAREAMNLRYLNGFAFITETRTVRLKAGETVLRFEGVADGIVPASAVIVGLPGGVVEKNCDAHLLSPAALIDGTLGRQVTLRRTDKASGAVHEEQATIVAGPAEGVVLQTGSGIETLRCSGLGEKVRYGAVPAGLSARPVLSVTTRSPRAATARVTLSYLASGFDWSASYVATLAPDAKSLDLFAWLTLANSNHGVFADADVQAVAGRVRRQAVREVMAAAARLELHCYPLGTTTSNLPSFAGGLREDIVVTGSSIMRAPVVAMMAAPAPPPPPPPPPPEDLGDLKLYRVPERVTVAANGQKQVALLVRQHVAFETVYRFALQEWSRVSDQPADIVLRLRNEEKDGLGIPLPAGTTAVYQPRGDTRLLLSLGTIGDVAKGERTRFAAGVSHQILATQSAQDRVRTVTLSNANPYPVPAEVAIGGTGDRLYVDTSAPLERIDGIQTWRATVPANGTAVLSYAVPKG
ncbi:DUF4139 domain-containing protein [Sphingomonas sp. MMS24-J13]|uniref:DUF4139 domain-containing protein n=1 Tax=Sphingomonas sp. MMS24-J13 TaxID=3238686 RepID=UPI00384A63D0